MIARSEMPRNDEGEFELVLGNKQLLSVFFIVVVLLGVFFTMGYIVGRNSAPVGVETATRRDKPIDLGSPSPTGSAVQPSPVKPAEGGTPLSPGQVEVTVTQPPQPVETRPVAETPRPPAEVPKPKPAEPVKAAEARPPRPEPVNASPAAPRVTEPSTGTYLQVSAVRRPEAEALAEILLKKGFRAVLTPSPRDGIFRVLVGPLRDAAEISKTKTDLEGAGMKSPFVQKF